MSIFKKHSRKEVVRAIEAHEVGPYKDTKEGWPYIFTGVSRRKDPSSAFGPRQITYSTIKNAITNYKGRGNKLSPELQEYADKLIAQGMNKVNLDKGAAKFYSDAGIGVEREATAEDRASFGSFGTGFIPREDHEKYYNKIADIVFDEKLKEAKALGVTDVDGFLRVYHGSKNPENNLDYQDKVNRYLEDPSLIDRKPGLFGMGMVIPGTRIGFNEGGDVSMPKQMELFNEGGLMDEGGTTDPVSGNDVPVGSLQKEVRDDIPAQLSEGEFVMPADVVRYHGLDKMMELRDEAKAGLARMEAMGQMGNSDEAIIPEGVPFNIDDLLTEDEPMQMQVGGFVPQLQPYSSLQGQQQTGFVPFQAMAPIQQSIPSPYSIAQAQPQTGPMLSAEQLVPQVQTEFRTYVNAEGQTLQIPFIDGKPLYPIPPGYTLQSTTAPQAPVQQQQVAPTATSTQQYQEDDPSDQPETPQGAVAVFGGQTYDLAYDTSKDGVGGLFGVLTGGVDRVTITDASGRKASMSRDLYNTLKENRNSATTQETLQRLFSYTDAADQQIRQSAGFERGMFSDNSKELGRLAAEAIYEDLGLEYKGQPLSEALMLQDEATREAERAATTTTAPVAADLGPDYSPTAVDAQVMGDGTTPPRTADGIGTGSLPSATLTTTGPRAESTMAGDSRSTPIGTGRVATEGDIARLFGQETTAGSRRLDPMGIGFDAGTRLTAPEEQLSDSRRMTRLDAPTAPVFADAEVATINRFGKTTDYQKVGDDFFRIKSDGTLARDPASGLTLANLRNPNSPLVTRAIVSRPTGDDIALPMARPTALEREVGMRLSPTLRDPAYREDAVDEQVMGRDDRRGQRIDSITQRAAEVEAMADRDFSNQLVREEQNRKAEIERERFEREERRVAAETERRNKEEQEENVRQGRGNIVTDSSGRPVISRSTGRAVTTARGQQLRESGSAGDAAIERQADALRREADDRERAEASRKSEQRVQEKIASGVDPEAAAFESGGNDEPSGGTYCCTASWKRNQMTITEIKELRRWHRQQSSMWQEGYDIWGKWVADNLVAKSDWSASVVKDVYEAFINKKYTAKGLFGLAVIIPGVYATAIYRRMKNYGRVTCTN